MSTNTLSFEGLTLKVVLQKGDLTYHGVPVRNAGSGALNQFMKQFVNVSSADIAKSITTNSSVLYQATLEDYLKKGTKTSEGIRDMRNIIISRYEDLQLKAKAFFAAVEGAKAAAIGSNQMKYLGTVDMEKLRETIKPYNVGPVLVVKIQARVYSKEALPGLRALRDGGYSTNRVLYKFYLPMMEFEEAHQIIKSALKEALESNDSMQVTRHKNVIRREIDNRGNESIVIRSQAATFAVKDTSTGEYNPLADLRAKAEEVKVRVSNMDLGI